MRSFALVFFFKIVTLGLMAQALPLIPIEKHAPQRIHQVVFQGQAVDPASRLATSMVMVSTKDQDGEVHSCSGVVISRRLILTAGHCVAFQYWEPGAITVTTTDEQVRPIKTAYTHPRYSGRKDAQSRDHESMLSWAEEDIAALELNEPLAENFLQMKFAEVQKGSKEILIAGFGISDYQVDSESKVVPVLTDELLMAPYRLTEKNQAVPASSSRQCGGDSGGGVFRMQGDQPILIGIVSRQLKGHDPQRECQHSTRIFFTPIDSNKSFVEKVLKNDFSGLRKFEFEMKE